MKKNNKKYKNNKNTKMSVFKVNRLLKIPGKRFTKSQSSVY